MKKFFVGCVLAAMVAMTVVAVSCSKDDDDAACWYISYTYNGQHYSGYDWGTKSELDKAIKEAKADGATNFTSKKTNHSQEECERLF